MECQEPGLEDDRTLARRIVAGDREALDAFTERFCDAVYAFAIRERRGVGEAEALTERALARAVAALEGYAGDAPLAAWTYAIVRAEVLRTRCAPPREAPAGCGTGSAWSRPGDETPS